MNRRTVKQWTGVAIALLTIVVAIALNACNPQNFKTQAAQVSQLIYRTPGDPKTFNYGLIAEAPNIRDLMYQGLVAENGKGELVPGLAESWKFSENKQQIVFTLRDGLKWSDGKPLTAEDVVFSYNNVYMNEKIPSYQDLLRIGQSKKFPTVRKLDDRRVEFTSPEPFAPFLRVCGIGIMPAHLLRQTVTEKDQNGNLKFLGTWGTDTPPDQIVGNGPYVIESYSPNQRIVYRRNPYYWEKNAQGNQLPYIDRIVWQIVEATDTALIQFRSGSLDIMSGLRADSYSLLKKEEKRGSFTIYNGGPDSSTLFISFNLNKGRRNGKSVVNPIKSRWFNEVKFRQAVAYALDRQTMLNNSLNGVGTLQDSPISVQSPYYLSPKEGLKVYGYNPEKAKQLLQEAGFKYDAAGQLFDADGNRVRFTMLSQTGSRLVGALAAQVKIDLSKIGIQVDYSPIDFATLIDKQTNTFDWECYLGGITGGVEPNDGQNVWSPDGSYHPFNQKPGTSQKSLEGREVYDWEEKIGQLYIQGARELDEAKRKKIYGETQQITQEYLPFIHLVNPLELIAIRNRIQDVEVSALFYESVLWNSAKLKVVE